MTIPDPTAEPVPNVRPGPDATPDPGAEPDATPEPNAEPDARPDPDAGRGRATGPGRATAGRLLTGLAGLVVLAALTLPDDYAQLRPGAFLRLPVEALAVGPLLVTLPPRPRRPTAIAAGVLLGLLAVVKVVDVGFTATLGRPFDLVLDWGLLADATGVVEDSVGRPGAIGAVLGAILLITLVLAVATAAVLRLARAAAGHRTATVRAGAALTVLWLAAAVAGAPLAARTDAVLVKERAAQVPAGLRDQREFRAEAAVDPFRDTPGDQLLTGLRGKDVVVTFVESYGRSAIEDPRFAPQVTAVLDAGTRTLDAAGFASRSGWLTSSTVGGGSWLAHSTLLSGLWIDNQERYRTLTASDRLTLPAAFDRAGWDTVSVEPAIDRAWPEGRFFGYRTAYDSRTLGFRGPRFSYATMPDQYTFAAFQRLARGPGHAPVMAEITLVSSHSPWTPLPRMVDWAAVGDGSVFATAAARQGRPAAAVLGDPGALRPAYRQAIGYSLTALISYVRHYGGEDLVMVFLGDHQAAPVITGTGKGRDVPVTIVAKDPAVLDRVAGWGWTPGLRPAPTAPVWRMDTFRNRFLTAFAPAPAPR